MFSIKFKLLPAALMFSSVKSTLPAECSSLKATPRYSSAWLIFDATATEVWFMMRGKSFFAVNERTLLAIIILKACIYRRGKVGAPQGDGILLREAERMYICQSEGDI